MKVYVDADACPVKDEIITTALKHQVSVVFIQSYSHFSHAENPQGVETIYVDPGFDSADYRIIQMAKYGDIIVTQDYGLASLGLSKGCKVLHHKGFIYSEKNIDQLLQTRYLSAKARRSGQRTKGPSAFTEEDRRKFMNVLEKVIIQNKKDMK